MTLRSVLLSIITILVVLFGLQVLGNLYSSQSFLVIRPTLEIQDVSK
jgi:hypothetical protein